MSLLTKAAAKPVPPGPVPKPEDVTSATVVDGPVDTHRIHNAVVAEDAGAMTAPLPPPPLAPSPYGAALPMPAEPTAIPEGPAEGITDMGGGAASLLGGVEDGGDGEPPIDPPDGGPPPTNPLEDFLLKGLMQGGGMRRMPALGGRG